MGKVCRSCGKELAVKVWRGKSRKIKESKKRFHARMYCDNICRSNQLSLDSSGKNNYFYGKHLKPWNYKRVIRWKVRCSEGYIKIVYKTKDGEKYFKYEHREVMENKLKRNLEKDELVHHIDGSKHNNDAKNLMICSRREHRKLHGANTNRLLPTHKSGESTQ